MRYRVLVVILGLGLMMVVITGVGLALYYPENRRAEVVTINTTAEREGNIDVIGYLRDGDAEVIGLDVLSSTIPTTSTAARITVAGSDSLIDTGISRQRLYDRVSTAQSAIDNSTAVVRLRRVAVDNGLVDGSQIDGDRIDGSRTDNLGDLITIQSADEPTGRNSVVSVRASADPAGKSEPSDGAVVSAGGSAERRTESAISLSTLAGERPLPIEKAASAASTGSAARAERSSQSAASAVSASTRIAIRKRWIQVIASPHLDRVKKVNALLREHSMRGVILTSKSGVQLFYRVRVGPFETQSEASKFLGWIQVIPEFQDSFIVIRG